MTAAATEVALVPIREAPGELTIEQVVAQTLKIQQCMELVMKDGEHYGVIPGTEKKDGKPPKKTLLKPGAEKLCLLFRLDPQYEIKAAVETPSLIRFTVCCTLYHIPTGMRTASGLGSCNSNEEKYLRPAPKKCTVCGKETVIKGNEQYGGGWLCWKKKGGCGQKWNDGDPAIEQQETGIKDPADLHNTILKMACKRALIAAVLNATAASDFFTQDLEDLTEKAAEYIPPKDDLKEKLEQSVKERSAPKAATAPSATAATASTNDASRENGTTTADTGEAATNEQKDAIKLHIRKKGWKRGFVRLWFAELFGIDGDDPLEALTQMQADAAHFLVMAHGTDNYRKVRHEYAQQGLVRRDEDDLQW